MLLGGQTFDAVRYKKYVFLHISIFCSTKKRTVFKWSAQYLFDLKTLFTVFGSKTRFFWCRFTSANLSKLHFFTYCKWLDFWGTMFSSAVDSTSALSANFMLALTFLIAHLLMQFHCSNNSLRLYGYPSRPNSVDCFRFSIDAVSRVSSIQILTAGKTSRLQFRTF